MSRAKRTRKFAHTKRVIGSRDTRLKLKKENETKALKIKHKNENTAQRIPQEPSQLFFNHNTALGPPYSILVDTSFLTWTVQSKLPLLETMMDVLYAKCKICITDCVMAELEKLGPKYRIALRVARDERWKRLNCDHDAYADDCLIERVLKHRVHLVATSDKILKTRLRKIPGCPIVSVGRGKYIVERLPDAM